MGHENNALSPMVGCTKCLTFWRHFTLLNSCVAIFFWPSKTWFYLIIINPCVLYDNKQQKIILHDTKVLQKTQRSPEQDTSFQRFQSLVGMNGLGEHKQGSGSREVWTTMLLVLGFCGKKNISKLQTGFMVFILKWESMAMAWTKGLNKETGM